MTAITHSIQRCTKHQKLMKQRKETKMTQIRKKDSPYHIWEKIQIDVLGKYMNDK